jgi:ligand-binding sensor domain-containing protein
MRLKESNHVRDANEEGLSIAIVSYIYTVLFRRILVIGCILVCIFCMSYSQQGMDSIFLNLETLKIKDGLSQGMVRSIIQDKEGYMWFATKDGLNRYDGYRISVYRNDLKIKYSLPDNYVTNLAEDEYGHFWVGTSTKGLLLFDKIKERFYPIDIIPQFQTLANKEIRFLECKGKNLILATTRNIYIFDISQFKSSEHSNLKQNIRLVFDYNKSGPKFPYQDPSDLSQSISWMPNKDLWVCRKDGIAICKPRSDLNQWELKEHPITDFGINKNNFTSIYPCKIHGQPKYFLQLREHILIYNDSSKLLEQDVKTAFNKSYTLPRADSNGNILFTISSDHYLFQSKYNKFLKIIPNKEKIHLSNLGFCIDQQGILWLGTNGFGVTKYDPKKQFFQATNTWQKRLSNSISSDPLLTKSGRPVKWNRAKNTYDDFLSGLFLKHKFTHIIEDSAGIVWMKSNFVDSLRSLISLDQKTKKIKEYFALNLYPKQFESFYLDRSNQIWMIFYNSTKMQSAIRLFDPIKDSFTKEYVIEINNRFYDQNSTISQCWQDPKGFFWLASLDGLIRLDIQNQKHVIWQHQLNDPNSLSNNNVYSICPDPIHPDQFLWVGTNGGGLNKFEYASGKFDHYTVNNGLPNNVIYGILNDDYGQLWLSTNYGISCVSQSKKKADKNASMLSSNDGVFFRNFTLEDGISDNEFNRYEFAKLKTGELVFGGIDGITAFHPKNFITDVSAPPIRISGLTVFNQPVNYMTNPSILDKPIQYAGSITLPYNQNMFTLEYAALDYSITDKKYYKYLLEGFNEQWMDNGTKNFISFTNLDPGEYEFKVTVSKNGGPWNIEPAIIKIIILPPWWATWWFRSFLFVLVVGGLYTLYRYRLQQGLKVLSLRNRIADDLHDDIGSTLSSISLSSTIIQNKIKDESGEIKNLLSQISTNTDNMMEAMSDIIWTINARNDGFEGVLLRMKTFAIELLEPQNCTVHCDVGERINKLKLNLVQRKNLYLIFKEAIHNIAKYARAKNVWVDITVHEKKYMLIKIKDDGIGMDGTNGNGFGGNGLPSMKRRAKELKGSLEIISKPNEGTEITLRFAP